MSEQQEDTTKSNSRYSEEQETVLPNALVEKQENEVNNSNNNAVSNNNNHENNNDDTSLLNDLPTKSSNKSNNNNNNNNYDDRNTSFHQLQLPHSPLATGEAATTTNASTANQTPKLEEQLAIAKNFENALVNGSAEENNNNNNSNSRSNSAVDAHHHEEPKDNNDDNKINNATNALEQIEKEKETSSDEAKEDGTASGLGGGDDSNNNTSNNNKQLASSATADEKLGIKDNNNNQSADPAALGTVNQTLGQSTASLNASQRLKKHRFLRRGDILTMNRFELSLNYFDGDGQIRNFLFTVYDHWAYDVVISLLVIFNIVLVVLDSPSVSEAPVVNAQLVFICDILILALFSIEIIGKIIALGLAMHPYAFLRDPGDFVDLVVVACGYIALFFASSGAEQRQDLTAATLRNLKILRIHRVVRLLMHFQVVRAIFMTLQSSVRGMRDIVALLLFIVLGMSVLGLQLFRGNFDQRCYFDAYPTNSSGLGTPWLVLDPTHPFGCSADPDFGHQCDDGSKCTTDRSQFGVSYANFDNIGNSFFTVLKIISIDNWHIDVRRMQFSTGLWYGVYATVIVIFGTFFTMNLVIGVLSAQYELAIRLLREEQEEQEAEEESEREMERLRQLEEERIKRQELMAAAIENGEIDGDAADPEGGMLRIESSGTKSGKFSPMVSNGHAGVVISGSYADFEGDEEELTSMQYHLVRFHKARRWFDVKVMSTAPVTVISVTVTLLNIAALAAFVHGMEAETITQLDYINFACGMYFILEVTLFIFARGQKYFEDAINVIDFLLALLTIGEAAVVGLSATGTFFSALRGLRMLRIVRLGSKIKIFRKMFKTVGFAAKSAAALFMVLVIYLIGFGIFAVFLFNGVMPPGFRPNFDNLGDALIALFIILTGENVFDTTAVAMNGSNPFAGLFLITFFWIGNYIILNFFVVILISSFSEAAELDLLIQDKEAEGIVVDEQGNAVVAAGDPDLDDDLEREARLQGQESGNWEFVEKWKKDNTPEKQSANNSNALKRNRSSDLTTNNGMARSTSGGAATGGSNNHLDHLLVEDAENEVDVEVIRGDKAEDDTLKFREHGKLKRAMSGGATGVHKKLSRRGSLADLMAKSNFNEFDDDDDKESSVNRKKKQEVLKAVNNNNNNNNDNTSGTYTLQGIPSASSADFTRSDSGAQQQQTLSPQPQQPEDKYKNIDFLNDDNNSPSSSFNAKNLFHKEEARAAVSFPAGDAGNNNSNNNNNNDGEQQQHSNNNSTTNTAAPNKKRSTTRLGGVQFIVNEDVEKGMAMERTRSQNAAALNEMMSRNGSPVNNSNNNNSINNNASIDDGNNNNNNNNSQPPPNATASSLHTDSSLGDLVQQDSTVSTITEQQRMDNFASSRQPSSLVTEVSRNYTDGAVSRHDELAEVLKVREQKEFTPLERLAEFLGVSGYETIHLNLKGDSMFCFGPNSDFRKAIAQFVSHPFFELFVLITVLESCIAIGFDNNRARRITPLVGQFMEVNNIVVSVIFILEAGLKMLAFGVISEETSYLRDPFNVFDFFIVIISVLSIFLPITSLRALRGFRLAAKWKAMRIVLESLARAIPGILHVIALMTILLFSFSVVGVHLFVSQLVECTDSSIIRREQCNGTFTQVLYNATNPYNGSVLTSATVVRDRAWVFTFFNFNDVANGMLSLLVVFFGDGWSTIFYNAMDAITYDETSDANGGYRGDAVIFFILTVVIGNFFVNNLFVGSLMNSFKQQQDYANGLTDGEGHALLTEEQQEWVRSYRFVAATALPQRPPIPENFFRRFCCWVWFATPDMIKPRQVTELFFSLCILITVAFMASEHDGQTQSWTDALFTVDLVLNVIFTVEVIISFVALRPLCFVVESWNVFNVFLVVATFISQFLGGPGMSALRVSRVARLLRLIPRAKGLHRMYSTLVYSLPELINVSVLFILILFMFGCIATQLFQDLYQEPNFRNPKSTGLNILTEMFNFEHAGVSMVVLFQMATTSGWADVVEATSNMSPLNSGCREESGNCGNPLAMPFFIIFMIVANSILLNLFIFVIVDQYLEIKQLQNVRIEWLLLQLETFRENWAQLDKERTRYLKYEAAALCYKLLLLQENKMLRKFREDIDQPVVVLRGASREVLVREVLAFHAIPTTAELELEMKIHYMRKNQTEQARASDALSYEASMASGLESRVFMPEDSDRGSLDSADSDDENNGNKNGRRRSSALQDADNRSVFSRRSTKYTGSSGQAYELGNISFQNSTGINNNSNNGDITSGNNTGGGHNSSSTPQQLTSPLSPALENVSFGYGSILQNAAKSSANASPSSKDKTKRSNSNSNTSLSPSSGSTQININNNNGASSPTASGVLAPDNKSGTAAGGTTTGGNNSSSPTPGDGRTLLSGGAKFSRSFENDLNNLFFIKRMKALRIPVHQGGWVAYEDCIFALTRFHLGCDELSDAARTLLQKVRKFDDNEEELQLHHALCARSLIKTYRRKLQLKKENAELQAAIEKRAAEDALFPSNFSLAQSSPGASAADFGTGGLEPSTGDFTASKNNNNNITNNNTVPAAVSSSSVTPNNNDIVTLTPPAALLPNQVEEDNSTNDNDNDNDVLPREGLSDVTLRPAQEHDDDNTKNSAAADIDDADVEMERVVSSSETEKREEEHAVEPQNTADERVDDIKPEEETTVVTNQTEKKEEKAKSSDEEAPMTAEDRKPSVGLVLEDLEDD